MDARERTILESLRFDAAPTEKTLWGGRLPHLPDLNQQVYDRLRHEITALHPGMIDSPPGLVVHGEFGSGKSHIVWWARKFIAGIGGYYFNIQPDGAPETLWTRVLASMVRDLCEPMDPHQLPPTVTTQLALAVERLAKDVGLDEPARAVVSGRKRVDTEQSRSYLRAFTDGVRSRHPSRGLRNVALALALLAIDDDDANAAGWAYLHDSDDEMDSRHNWDLRPVRPASPDEVVRHLSQLLAKTGPSLFVVDQIDELVVRSAQSTESAASDGESADLAAALMTIREKLTRSITLISCLEHTWETIRSRAARSALDRFHGALRLNPIPNGDTARRLAAVFLAPQFQRLGFAPPYDTWPIPPAAFDEAAQHRPRQLIQLVGEHVRECVAAGELVPVTVFQNRRRPPDGTGTADKPEDPEASETQTRYLSHRRTLHVDGLKETSAERDLADVLTGAARALATEAGLGESTQVRDACRGAEKASIHCEITTAAKAKILIRGINTISAAHVGQRVDNARAVAAAETADSVHLFIVRTNPWKPTTRIKSVTNELAASNGVVTEISDDDLRTLRAVQLTTTSDTDEVRQWLRDTRPVSGTELGRALLKLVKPESGTPLDSSPKTPDATPPATPKLTDAPPMVAETVIPLGLNPRGEPVTIELPALRKHVAMFAASGSGKTVLLRRIIEECALRGVSTIVLDPNNDLARLGDAWPSNPDGWWPGDEERSLDYLKNTDVVVWTPGVSRGNPLTLQPFPDFTAVRDDPDDLRLAIETAVASLAPRARIDAENHQADGRRAVLRVTLREFARRGGGDLGQLIELLREPSDEVLAALPSADRHATYVASALAYARSNDPLFDGEGVHFDPDRLLAPANGYRARVSVINLAGIPDENRPAFVNRLQMALFTWIKRHPARDKPLSGLFIMDEAQTFIPSGRNTPCTESTRNLASQARKYGLGLVYATQAPRGIDSRITGNAATHVYGRVVVPPHVGAVNDMARARGDEPPPISQLTAGRFYVSLEGHPLTQTTVPMCLSHHGPPLEEGEISERARSKRRQP
ncbi:ATP-binding protein [Stackebrandtia nassauensis]|uniref:AAA ATPase n=1 Tax=Stackebrandtia nassauensis (strain DSM 44728 / CIP 108903 / NRRL B-16338 / NBRC 102104 / LLR-40K-21) TaxID=446470 RepID=D3PZT2_STANL|nr:ATP-binding protein [Stackebrandtia nassauensis]ADD43619.1 AAA ATPase [Stackebrandtia nassauensis DSM 44728]